MKQKIIEINNCINEIKRVAVSTKLYRKMLIRKGQFAIFKGSYKPKYLLIGEAPGKTEDKVGKPFVGRCSNILNGWLETLKMEDYAIINVVPILPTKEGKVRKPTSEEIKTFEPYVTDLILKLNPKYIILLGRSANKAITNEHMKCGEWFNKTGFIYHPSYYLRNGKNGMDDWNKLIINRKV